MVKQSMSKQEKQWQQEDDARTLQRAAEIAADKARKQAAERILREQQKAIEKVLKPSKKK